MILQRCERNASGLRVYSIYRDLDGWLGIFGSSGMCSVTPWMPSFCTDSQGERLDELEEDPACFAIELLP